jgi:hypothetical protein
MPRPTRYIGITDFFRREEVEQMRAVLERHPKGRAFRLHVGVMMSFKTLRGIPTKWATAFPPKETIADVFACPDTMNCLHFADREARPTADVRSSLIEALAWGGAGMNALQLDMTWPDPDVVAEAVASLGRPIEVILQVGDAAFEEVSNHPNILIKRLADYRGCVTHVLLDKSGGRGIGIDAVGLLPFAHAIARNYPHLGIVAAGGLGPTSMSLVRPLTRDIPNISIDAQGRLRRSGSALDPIDWDLAEQYLIAALDQLPA